MDRVGESSALRRRDRGANISRWMFILLPEPNAMFEEEPTKEQYLSRVKEMIGDETIDAEIKNISKWYINETVAERYSDGNNM